MKGMTLLKVTSTKQEVLRRAEILRNHNRMTRTEFGKPTGFEWRGNTVMLTTTKHRIILSHEGWEALGQDTREMPYTETLLAKAH